MSELVGPPFRSVCTADRGVNTQVCEHLAKVVLTRVNTWQKWVLIQLYEQCVNVNPGALVWTMGCLFPVPRRSINFY